ncbi:monoacylglycerol/Diacylglycerol O-acyltransferase isoform X1 [Zootoca vivipara]|uniref:monoacylglycerol/Diacylglycerol O-acyltransferase isoform X1 n=2 Tax=Zootoca vivipara TaxID=8524 RepID=UPI00293BF86B|nr:monoacylglycerol/Diacylglycerol O-acyltransferase isoform X1 [Zootoca vivipara]
MSWFTQMLQKLISFPYLEEYWSSVVHPWWFRKLLVLLCSLIIGIYLAGCACSFWLYVYKKMNKDQETDSYSKIWEKPRRFIAHIVDTYGKIWHGFELTGTENLPKGPGIIIYHHAVAPLGYILFVARYFLERERMCYSLMHRFGHWMPGLQMFFYVIGLKFYKQAEIVQIMKKGHLLGISPGGAREAMYSHDYSFMWGKRTGFARAAMEAKVPIIPIFTQNNCETYRTIGKTRLTQWLYDKTRCMYLPIYGGFPVKLRTFIGEPIPYDPNITAVELAERVKTALENLRDKHQKRPGNILRALSERFDKHYKAD